MRIPEHIIDRIRRETDIVDIISDVVALKQRGRNFVGLCPFHQEKTPSFNVLPEKGIFKCFGCGKGGDAITFIREYQKLSYSEALRFLAERLGITIPDTSSSEHASSEHKRYDAVYTALRLAANFYWKVLHTELGSTALQYLYTRGFSDETIKKFGLGFAPDSFHATMTELLSLGVTEEAVIDAGLVARQESTGRLYDRFRGRLMFPVQNSMGRVIGFGGRRINDAEVSSAKYINSPQSLVYNKSEVLYGIFQAKDALRRRGYAILVEGYADVLSVSQAGFPNVVASSGTSLTREHLRLLSRFCTTLKLIYDGDAAGIAATLKALDMALEEGFQVEIVRLPAGEDPDSYIQHNGAQGFQSCLDKGLSLVEFKIELFREQGLLHTPHGNTEAVRSILQSIAKIPSQIHQDFMIRSVAHRFSLRETDVYAEFTQILRQHSVTKLQERTTLYRQSTTSRPRPQPETQNAQSIAASTTETAPIASSHTSQSVSSQQPHSSPHKEALFPEEEELLRIALTAPGAYRYMTTQLGIARDSFMTHTARMIFAHIQQAAQHGLPLDYLLQRSAQGEEIPEEIHGLALRPETPSERWAEFGLTISCDNVRLVHDCTTRLHLRFIECEMQQLLAQHHQATLMNNTDEAMQYLAQIHSIDQRKRELEARLFR